MKEEETPHEEGADVKDAEFDDELGKRLSETLHAIIKSGTVEELQKIELALKIIALRGDTKERVSSLEKERTEAELAQLRTAFLEFAKLRVEVYKAQNVLSSGALVAFTTITAALIPDPDRLWLLGLAYIFIVWSIIATSFTMFDLTSDTRKVLTPGKSEEKRSRADRLYDTFVYLSSPGGFVVGLGAFLEFVRSNLF